ncbi:SCO-spondin-like isoform X2 [Dreissena polymorpha]|uniref:SCO-spondin-like isoform X2 n=1 Tax=Dreissena polymorpha TaxID=45954 RepID=UPI0022643836|nr:SCO-spondin-like isoform X2 [Dreissena polymorpha]
MSKECLECFSCQNIADPDECRNTSQCSSGQSCSLQTSQAGSDLRFNMGVNTISYAVPSLLAHTVSLDAPFRPDSSPHVMNAAVQTAAMRTFVLIENKGESIFLDSTLRCANMCHIAASECTDDEKLDCAFMHSIFNVCADIHHAKITCPKFCGLCQLVDGNWAAWANWSSCSVTCEDGKQTRTRTCTNPQPSNGGLNCTGPASDTKLCTKQLCPVHGNWTEWSTWSGCSVTCDVGLRKRTRSCTNPKPDRSGDFCVGESSEYTVCLTDPCSTRNGGWSSWGSWQSCSVTCGGGLKLRSRTCTSPSPSAYGKACEGNFEAFAVCVNTPCYAVAFNAHGHNVLSNFVNAFPTVIFNEGNAYHASSGHFTAPVDGLYYFTAQFCCIPQQECGFFIEKSNASISSSTHLTATFEHHTTDVACTSASTSVKLNRNEHVWVLIQGTSSYLYDGYNGWNTFTGTLIQEL